MRPPAAASAASCGVLTPSVPHSLDHARASTVAISLRSSIKNARLSQNAMRFCFWSRRDRRPRFGDPVQFDGNRHDRFGGRGKKCCLMNMAGDAAGKTLSMLFEEETAAAAMTLRSCQIKKH
ncbi:MAG: hypothetical protein LBK61_03615 [Spirochaetaceae bacterium]|nr:hypothetical protein [Spirochaetaceae bacterium]